VEEYTREFEQLLLKCDLREDDSQTMVRFLSGLNENIAHVVELHPYSTLDELSSLAHKVEQQRKTTGKDLTPKPNPRPIPTQQPPYFNPRSQTAPTPRNAPPTVQDSSTKETPHTKGKIRCFRCQGLGHIASECPNKRVVTLTEYQASFEELEEEEEDEREVLLGENIEEVEEGPDEGEMLMLRSVMSGLKEGKEGQRRTSSTLDVPFKRRCVH